jgi:DNA-directed RNA polymerase, mitochondrial
MDATDWHFWKQQAHRARSMGYGGTVEGLAIIREHTPRLALAIGCELDAPSGGWERRFKASLRRLKLLDLAGATLWAVISAIANRRDEDSDAITIKMRVGDAILTEVDFDYMRRGKPGRGGNKAKPGTHAAIIREAAEEGSLEGKRRVAAQLAAEAGFQWSSREWDLRAGAWLWAVCLTALPDVFMEENGVPEIRPEAVDDAFKLAMQHMRRHPVFSLSDEPPNDWVGYWNGGYWTGRSKFKAPFVRNVRHPEDVEMYRRAMGPGGSMRPHMAGVSRLQSVPWSINWRVLHVLEQIESLGHLDDLLGKPTGKTLRKRKRQEANNRTRLKMAVLEARSLMTFYMAKNCDRRGRVYSTTHFSLEREDHVRGLHLFAYGEPLSEDGLYWLKIHLANCGDVGKISKRPFDERVRWVDDNLDQILACASQPVANCYWWKEAAEPAMFLAACFEFADALEAIQEGRTFYSRLPISFDGTCSGFQHLALMKRDLETARLVNLVPSDVPQDIYQEVADRVKARLEAANDPIAKVCLEWGINRKLLKPCVMTFPYSVSSRGMRDQLRDGIKEGGKKPDRAALVYLVKCLRKVIAEVAPGAVTVQKYLRKIAGVLARVGLPVCWMSPTGFPCVSRAQKPLVKTVDITVTQAVLRYQHKFAAGYEDGISKAIAENRISPNVTHSCDASHLICVAHACAAKGIFDFGMIHDAFCCHASNAASFRKIILEELSRMYRQHNILDEIRDRAEKDIAGNPMAAAIFKKENLKLPDVPELGRLDVMTVQKAEYAFN